jgi:hypothetical protein
VTAAESGTYTDFANINVGGLRPDGSDGVNDVSYLLLDVIDDMHLPSKEFDVNEETANVEIPESIRGERGVEEHLSFAYGSVERENEYRGFCNVGL